MPLPHKLIWLRKDDPEVEQRDDFVKEARTWIGTPYRQLGGFKGAGVDCCMLIVRSLIEAGIVQDFDPRPYPPEWHLHRDEERYLNWFQETGTEVAEPKPGDIAIFQFGRCFSHSAIIEDREHYIHAHAGSRSCVRVRRDLPQLVYLQKAGKLPRPTKFFDVWAKLRETN